MTAYLVVIPGIVVPYAAVAASSDQALADALAHHALNFAPPGTTVTEVKDLR